MIADRRVIFPPVFCLSHFCASSSSGPSVLLNTKDKVLIPEGLPIWEIIPPLCLPFPWHCIVLCLDGVIVTMGDKWDK